MNQSSLSNKERALDFLNLIITGKIREAYKKHVAQNFKHHNAYFPGDAESLMKGMEESQDNFPNKKFHTHHALQDGEMVAVFSHVILEADKLEVGVVHIFKFNAGLIEEMWDIGQQVPADSPNDNGMF